MTPREYLNQAYRLENKIKALKVRVETLRALSTSISCPGFDEHYNATRNTDAPFVKTVDKIVRYEEEVDNRLKLLIALREQILEQIDKMESMDEALVLELRYIHHMGWVDIGSELLVNERTVRRWHGKALTHFELPKNPITIKQNVRVCQ